MEHAPPPPPPRVLSSGGKLNEFFFPQCTSTFSLEVSYQNSKVHFEMDLLYLSIHALFAKSSQNLRALSGLSHIVHTHYLKFPPPSPQKRKNPAPHPKLKPCSHFCVPQSEGEGEESGGEEEEEEEEEEDSAGGFSGIRNHSVDEIIAKARFTESFLTMSAASVGLTDNLEELARLGEEEEEEEEGE